MKILEEEAKNLDSGNIFDGKTAFKLYDTYGFPIDLTEDLLRDKGLSLDKDQFDISMKKQKDDAKKSWLGSGEKKTDEIWFEVLDINKKTEFLGYKESELSAQVVSIISNGKLVNKIEEGDEGILIFNRTPFYAESGGQVGDIGIISGNGCLLYTSDAADE